jgi:hypothetical protein
MIDKNLYTRMSMNGSARRHEVGSFTCDRYRVVRQTSLRGDCDTGISFSRTALNPKRNRKYLRLHEAFGSDADDSCRIGAA